VTAGVGSSRQPVRDLGRGIVEDDHLRLVHCTIAPAAASAGR
jgi:hypothetical protein